MLRIFLIFLQNFFYLFPHKHLQIYTISKNLRFSFHLRKSALIIEGRVLFEPPCKNQIVN